MEKDILHRAMQSLELLNVVSYKIKKPKKGWDALVVLNKKGYQQEYCVEVKKKLMPVQVPNIIEQKKDLKHFLLVADYLPAKTRVLLKEQEISYIDTVGNMFLMDEGVCIFVETHKNNRASLTIGNRAFLKTGLKVVYQFLLKPDLINQPYRIIGQQAEVSIDTVSQVIKDLLQEQFLIQVKDKEYDFVNRKGLFEEWISAFNRNLRPKLKQKRYRLLSQSSNWKKKQLPKGAYWGGLVAAEKMTDYLIADQALIYTHLDFFELMKELKAIPDKEGDLLVVDAFWGKQEEKQTMVSPILVYTDLIYKPTQRNLEAAQQIYKKYVQDYL